MRNWKWLVTAALPLLWMLPAAGVPVWSGAAKEPVPPPKAAPGQTGERCRRLLRSGGPGGKAGGFPGRRFRLNGGGDAGGRQPARRDEARTAPGGRQRRRFGRTRIGAPKEAGNFRVWAFSSGLQLFPDLEPCGFRDRSAVERLNRFVGALGAGGSTNMLMAWRKILELTKHRAAGHGLFPVGRRPERLLRRGA